MRTKKEVIEDIKNTFNLKLEMNFDDYKFVSVGDSSKVKDDEFYIHTWVIFMERDGEWIVHSIAIRETQKFLQLALEFIDILNKEAS